jgi:putative Mg2+ transporter-C (MgtC) family protein
MLLNEAAGLLFLAAVLGAAIGFQREFTQRPAGLRTHALVSLGACSFAEYSTLLHDTRIAAGVITGIGFLGAGAIVRHGLATRGLTTAASIWTASAIGLGLGLGGTRWLPIATALVLLTLVILVIPDEQILTRLPRRTRLEIEVEIDPDRLTIDRLLAELRQLVDRAKFNDQISIGIGEGGRRATVGLIVWTDVHANLPHIFDALSAIAGVVRVSVTSESSLPS